MNSPIVTSSNYQLASTSAYTVFQPMSEGSIPFSQTYKPSSSWRRFIRTSTQQSGPESAVTIIPVERTTTAGPTVFKPAPLPEDYDARIESFLHFIDSL